MSHLNDQLHEQDKFPALALGRPLSANLAPILDALAGLGNFNKDRRACAFGYAIEQFYPGPLLRQGFAVLFRKTQAQRWAGRHAPNVEMVALDNFYAEQEQATLSKVEPAAMHYLYLERDKPGQPKFPLTFSYSDLAQSNANYM